MLTAIAPEMWGAHDDLFMPGGIHFPVRMTVVRLPSGGLLLHSPIRIDDALAEALAELGPVEHIVAPNKLHHLFFGKAAARYPEAQTWAAPGLAEKRDDLTFGHTLGAETPPWGEIFAPLAIDGVPWANETVFFHRPSGTLVVTDLFFNLHTVANRRTRFLFRLMGILGRPQQSKLLRFATKDKPAASASARRVIALPIERAVPAHGEVIESDAKAVVTGVLRTMLGKRQAALAA